MVAPADRPRIEVRLTPGASRDLLEDEMRLSDGRRVLSARLGAVRVEGDPERLVEALALECRTSSAKKESA